MNHYCKEYDDNCEGCQPAIMDPRTGYRYPADSFEMTAIRAYWKTVPIESKKACHRVWCFNSRESADLQVIEAVSSGLETALRGTPS